MSTRLTDSVKARGTLAPVAAMAPPRPITGAQRESPGTVRQRESVFRNSPWSMALWSLALLGVVLLPTNFRAGAATAHAHSLVQLWLDAAHGSVHHHDPRTGDWLDPAVGAESYRVAGSAGDRVPDAGHQEDAAPAVAGFHFVLSLVFVLPVVTAGSSPLSLSVRRMVGRTTRVPSPPPRLQLTAA